VVFDEILSAYVMAYVDACSNVQGNLDLLAGHPVEMLLKGPGNQYNFHGMDNEHLLHGQCMQLTKMFLPICDWG